MTECITLADPDFICLAHASGCTTDSRILVRIAQKELGSAWAKSSGSKALVLPNFHNKKWSFLEATEYRRNSCGLLRALPNDDYCHYKGGSQPGSLYRQTWSVFQGTGRGGLTVEALLTLTRSHAECYVLFLLVHKGSEYKPPDLALCRASCGPHFQRVPTNNSYHS